MERFWFFLILFEVRLQVASREEKQEIKKKKSEAPCPTPCQRQGARITAPWGMQAHDCQGGTFWATSYQETAMFHRTGTCSMDHFCLFCLCGGWGLCHSTLVEVRGHLEAIGLLFLSTPWVIGIEFSLSGLAASVFAS